MPDKTPLYEAHVRDGARMVEFAGWLLPVQYSGIIEEHKAVRSTSGIFDIGHMGQIEVPDLKTVQHLTTNDASKLEKWSGQYSFICGENGGIIDDLLVYKLDASFLVISNGVNAGNVFSNFKKVQPGTELMYDKRTMLAVQGPKTLEILKKYCDIDLRSMKHRQILPCALFSIKCLVSRSGYSGEDGVELILSNSDAQEMWSQMLDCGIVSCGLGARDSLRIEAGLPLYGHELSLDLTPLDAGYFKTVKLEKDDFVGKNALLTQREHGIKIKLTGFEVLDRAIPRQGYKIFEGENEIGRVTSGTFSPTLEKPIGMAYLKGSGSRGQGQVSAGLSVEIRGTKYPIKIVEMPFYKRNRL